MPPRSPSAQADLLRALELRGVPESIRRALREAHARGYPITALDAGARELLAARLQEQGEPELSSRVWPSPAPRYVQEAIARGVRDVCVLYGKADGLIFRVGLPEQPFLVGGDYDGAREATPLEAAIELERLLPSYPHAAWFRPFLNRVLRGKGFRLDRLLRCAGPRNVYRFDRRANWG